MGLSLFSYFFLRTLLSHDLSFMFYLKYKQIFMPILNRLTILKAAISEFSTSDVVKEIALSQHVFSTALSTRRL